MPAQLLVGTADLDDAAVYQLNDEQVLVATTDFFMPIVDDPCDFGRIAAANALSDVYAMGGTPIMALALMGVPVGRISPQTMGQIARGGAQICQQAQIPIAGGHTVDAQEPFYGLVALGLASPGQIRKNSGAQVGDVLILGKALGTGVLSAAFKKDLLDAETYAVFVAAASQLNAVGAQLAQLQAVHAMTDVTGFGLLGHSIEMAQASGLSMQINYADLPWLPQVQALARRGVTTGAAKRNQQAYKERLQADDNLPEAALPLLSDPQTNGGLLVSCGPAQSDEVLRLFKRNGFDAACIIGQALPRQAHDLIITP